MSVNQTLPGAEVAYLVSNAKTYMNFTAARRADAMTDAEVLAIEWRRVGRIMRKLLKAGGRPMVEAQAVEDYTRVTRALAQARKAEKS